MEDSVHIEDITFPTHNNLIKRCATKINTTINENAKANN